MNYLRNWITNGKQNERRKEMKPVKLITTLAIAAAVMAAFVAPHTAWAIGTDAGVSITNTVDVNYTVNLQVQPAVQGTTSFVVDQKVDMTAVPASAIATSVLPGQTGAIFAFNVANTGNTVMDLILAPSNNLPAGTTWNGYTDTIDMSGFSACWDIAGDNSCAGDPVYVDELPPNGLPATVLVVANAPGAAVDLDASVIDMLATAAVGGNPGNPGIALVEDAGPWTQGTVQVVFADTGRNGSEVANGAYVVESATLTVLKSALPTLDPLGRTDVSAPPAMAIPGAEVTYTVTVQNSGSVDADSITVTDTTPANTTFVAASMNASTDSATGPAPVVTENGGAPWDVTLSTLGPGETLTVDFIVTIN